MPKYYKRLLCNHCRQVVVGKIVWEQFVSPSTLVRIECPTCHGTECKLLSPEEYKRAVIAEEKAEEPNYGLW